MEKTQHQKDLEIISTLKQTRLNQFGAAFIKSLDEISNEVNEFTENQRFILQKMYKKNTTN